MLVYLSASGDNTKKVIAHSMMIDLNTVKQVQDSDGREVYEVDLSGYEKVLPVLKHATSRLTAGLKARYLEHILQGKTLQIFVRKMGAVKSA